ncbi:MAG TPA: hypothetical protein VMS22_00975 [Candidatus Eisenbacteria bacterium]|nr:hypothetical protein [Candidatus Eisenbacteria bacterium]
MPIRKTLVGVVLAATLALAASAGAASGRAVGVTTLTFTKTSVTTGLPRVLTTVVWYPAVPKTGIAEAFGQRDATVRRGRFPLVVFSHGTCGRPTEASYFTKALASQGYVVAAPPHPGNTIDDGLTCATNEVFLDSAANRVPDVRFTLDSMLAANDDSSSPFFRRLRPDEVAMSGLSFGGFTTLLAVQEEPRFVTALALVPGGTAFLMPGDIGIPMMVIGSERDTVVGFAESQRAYDRLAGPRFLVELLAANHLSVVDDCYNATFGLDLCIPGDISQDAAHRLVLRYALPFFRRYLAGRHVAPRELTKQVEGVVLTAEPRRK